MYRFDFTAIFARRRLTSAAILTATAAAFLSGPAPFGMTNARAASVGDSAAAQSEANLPGAEDSLPAVVFVHGMNDTAGAFTDMKKKFVEAGWPESDLFAWDFEGWRDSNQVNAMRFIDAVNNRFGTTRKVAVVAHSLGSIPTRLAIQLSGRPYSPESANHSFGNRIVSWTSLGGPNLGPGQKWYVELGLGLACGKGILRDLVTASTCELNDSGFMELLNRAPTPLPTDYEEIYSPDDGVVDNGVSRLPEAPNNRSLKIDGVTHGDLPRNSRVIDHVVTRVRDFKDGAQVRPDSAFPPCDMSATTVTHGELTYVTSFRGAVDPKATDVRVVVTNSARKVIFDQSVTQSNGRWSLPVDGRMYAGDFLVKVIEKVNGASYEATQTVRA
ncbi:esterase/lipase family protein [Streptomyces kronopolitis]|uniref:esterase/lipase family protein n=1 Tax=Streptomyces kronopolitis TaxID=1612435 RepID=UPI00342349F3